MVQNTCPKCGSPNTEQIDENLYQCPYCGTTFTPCKQTVSNEETSGRKSVQQTNKSWVKILIVVLSIAFLIICFCIGKYIIKNHAGNEHFADTIYVVQEENSIEDEKNTEFEADITENSDYIYIEEDDELYEYILEGTMSDEYGVYPIRMYITKRGKQCHEYDENLVKCIYQNVDLGGKIKMEGTKTSDNNGYRFVGKDGSYKFIIETHEDEGGIQIGYAYDGPKTLSVKLESI